MKYKTFTINQNRKWINILDEITQNYNNKIHTTTKEKPKDIFEKRLKIPIVIEPIPKLKPNFNVGDRVRISYKRREVFDKAYLPNWTWEIFIVKAINKTDPITYILKDEKGEDLKGSFYESELQKPQQKKDFYLVEKVLKYKTEKGKKYGLVKWLGYEDETWEPIKNIDNFNIMK